MNGAHSSGLEPIEEEPENHLRHHRPSMDVMRSINSSTDTLDRLLDDSDRKSEETIKTISRGNPLPSLIKRSI
jgi:hypothetical protein